MFIIIIIHTFSRLDEKNEELKVIESVFEFWEWLKKTDIKSFHLDDNSI